MENLFSCFRLSSTNCVHFQHERFEATGGITPSLWFIFNTTRVASLQVAWISGRTQAIGRTLGKLIYARKIVHEEPSTQLNQENDKSLSHSHKVNEKCSNN